VTNGAAPAAEPPMLQSLRRVLTAFSIYVPQIGYCQSLNFIAGLLLLFMDEEKSFWMLHIITHQYLPGLHHRDLEGVNVDQAVLMMCVKESLGKIWQRVNRNLDDPNQLATGTANPDFIVKLPPVTLVTASWFMSIFINALPIESVLRVWDCLFYEGSKILFRVALTIFKLGETQIENVRDPMEILQIVQSLPKSMIDCGALMETCFRRNNGFGHIPQQQIEDRREQVRQIRSHATSGKTGVHADASAAILPSRRRRRLPALTRK